MQEDLKKMFEETKFTTGVDIVDFVDVEKLVKNERGRKRCFTQAEQDYCNQGGPRIQSYAARFAAKEAVLKALGKGILDGLPLNCIEILNTASGKPIVRFHKVAKEYIERSLEILDMDVSLSHGRDVAVAIVVIACKKLR